MNDESHRVYRGGCWRSRPSDARVALRLRFAPGFRFNFLGVRLVRQLSPLVRLAEIKETERE